MPDVQGGSNTIARQSFAGSEIDRRAETAATSAAAVARAQAEFHYVMAFRNPRDWEEVRLRLLRECERPVFAREAYYHKPIGEGVTGLSIRFAEKALTCMRNVGADTVVKFDDDDKRIVSQVVTDYENNVTFAKDIVITKLVERRQLREGQEAVSSRLNSKDQIAYLVRASEDDLLNKEGALISKAMRTNVLRMLPGDIQYECEQKIIGILASADQVDPEGRKKAMLAEFYGTLGVKPQQLAVVLGHDLDVPLNPAEFSLLRGLFNAIRDGETTIAAAMDNAREQRGEDEAKPEEKPSAGGTAERVRQKVTRSKPAPAAPTEAPADTPAATGETDPKAIATKLQTALVDLANGNMAEAEVHLSSATAGKVQKFADLATAVAQLPGIVEQTIQQYIDQQKKT